MYRDAILEIGCEEIPARFMPSAIQALQEIGKNLLESAHLQFERVSAFGAPRRLVLYISELEELQKETVREVRGPAKRVAFDESGQPTRAAMGFARAQGVRVEDLVVKSDEKGEYVFAEIRSKGEPAISALSRIFPRIITSLPFPKTMRWGDHSLRFVRPIRWLLALYGDELVDFEIDGIHSGSVTFGHRFLSRGPIAVKRAEGYHSAIQEGGVVLDQDKRREIILAQALALAQEVSGRPLINPGLLEEIIFLCEHPRGFRGEFPSQFLDIPRDVLITTMEKHQRYIPIEGPDGRLMPYFIAFRDGGDYGIDEVRRGNERVLRARLADARFFYDEDRKIPLADYVERLGGMTFIEGLGTIRDKTDRLVELSGYLASELDLDEHIRKVTERSAFLCKADLATNMVREFTELQGVMGRDYALSSGEDPEVAMAIFEHYLPRFAEDILPETLPGAVVGIADKIDTIGACFMAGLEPTGSQDPYALRRQSSGIIAIIVKHNLKLSMEKLIQRGIQGLNAGAPQKVVTQILSFMEGRMKSYLLEKGIRYDLVDAVIGAGFDDVLGTVKRAQALHSVSARDEFYKMATGFTRAANIAGKQLRGPVDESLLMEDAERRLYSCYLDVKDDVERYREAGEPEKMILSVAKFAEPIDEFFSNVLVMAEDEKVKANRLNLLSAIAALVGGIADMSKVVIAKNSMTG